MQLRSPDGKTAGGKTAGKATAQPLVFYSLLGIAVGLLGGWIGDRRTHIFFSQGRSP